MEKTNKKIEENRHDGRYIPSRPAPRHTSSKPTIFYIGVDESDDFTNWGGYVMPNGNLTAGASNNDFKRAGVTKDVNVLKNMLNKVIARYGKDKYIFVFKEEYTYGMQTHKNHARQFVIDIWYPNYQYWRNDLRPLDAFKPETHIDVQMRK